MLQYLKGFCTNMIVLELCPMFVGKSSVSCLHVLYWKQCASGNHCYIIFVWDETMEISCAYIPVQFSTYISLYSVLFICISTPTIKPWCPLHVSILMVMSRNYPYFWNTKTNEVSWYPPTDCRYK